MPFTPQELEEIKRQQMAANGGVPPAPPPPDPYYSPQPMPFPGATVKITNPSRDVNAELSAARQTAMLPSQADKSQSDAQIAKLNLRELRMKQGLDPDTGKPLANAGVVGNDALSDLTEGQKDIVKGITQGRVPVTSLAMARNPEMYKLVQRAFQYEPGTDLTTFARRQAAFQKFTSNPNSPMVRVNQALQHLDRFADNAKSLGNAHSSFFTNPLNIDNYARASYMAMEKDPKYQAFATDRDALATELAAAFQGGGQSALADREHWKSVLSAANSPEAFDTIIKEAVGLLGGRVEASNAQFKQAVGANAEFYDLMSPGARKVFEKYAPDAPPAPSDPEEKVLGTNTKTVDVPKGYQDAHSAFLQMHPKGSLTADAYRQLRQSLDKQFLPPNEASHLSDEEVNAFVDKYNKGAEAGKIPGIDVPLSAEEKDNNARASTPGGTMLLKTADAMALGVPDLLIGQEGRDKMALLDEKNPNAAMAGDVIGSVASMAGLEKLGVKGIEQLSKLDKIKALLSPSARKRFLGDVAVNATYGGVRGFNAADEGQGTEGALEGAASGAVAAGAGNLTTQGVKPILSDATSRALAQLKGVDTTTFQKLGLGKVEKILTNLPGVHGARSNAEVDFNRNNSNRVLQRIGETLPHDVETGLDANAYVNKRLNTSYNEIKPLIKGSEDGTFVKNVDVLKTSSSTGRDYKKVWSEIQDAINLFKDENGHYTGEGYLAASEKLRELSKDLNKGTYSQNIPSTVQRSMARTADQTKTQMQQLIQRETPEVGAKLKALERAWKHQSVIEDATNKSLKNGGIYAPGDLLDSTRMAETNRKLAARGKAFDQGYASAGQKIMGANKVGDIAPDRMFYTGLGVTGAGIGAHAVGATTVAPASAVIAAAAYLPGVKRITQAVLSGKRISVADRAIVERAANGEFGEGFQKLGTAIKNGATEKIIRRSLEDATRHKMTGN